MILSLFELYFSFLPLAQSRVTLLQYADIVIFSECFTQVFINNAFYWDLQIQ